MSSSMILSESLIESGRDIPLKELLYAKRVLDNYMAVAKESSPLELLTEMKSAAKQVEYFTTTSNPCEARNDRVLRSAIPGAVEPEVVAGAGHFVQEDAGEELARIVVGFATRRP